MKIGETQASSPERRKRNWISKRASQCVMNGAVKLRNSASSQASLGESRSWFAIKCKVFSTVCVAQWRRCSLVTVATDNCMSKSEIIALQHAVAWNSNDKTTQLSTPNCGQRCVRHLNSCIYAAFGKRSAAFFFPSTHSNPKRSLRRVHQREHERKRKYTRQASPAIRCAHSASQMQRRALCAYRIVLAHTMRAFSTTIASAAPRASNIRSSAVASVSERICVRWRSTEVRNCRLLSTSANDALRCSVITDFLYSALPCLKHWLVNAIKADRTDWRVLNSCQCHQCRLVALESFQIARLVNVNVG